MEHRMENGHQQLESTNAEFLAQTEGNYKNILI